MNQVGQVRNVGRQTDELVVAQVQLRQVTKVPQGWAQICNTTCTTGASEFLNSTSAYIRPFVPYCIVGDDYIVNKNDKDTQKIIKAIELQKNVNNK